MKRKWINGEGKLRTRVLNLLIENWFSINSVHNFRNSESKSRTRVSNFRIRSGFRYKQTLNFFLIPSTPKSNIGGKKQQDFKWFCNLNWNKWRIKREKKRRMRARCRSGEMVVKHTWRHPRPGFDSAERAMRIASR